jgi:hypothetical protein
MAVEAGAFSEIDPRLDFSVASVAVMEDVAARMGTGPRAAGAYIGEVLVRNGSEIYWCKRPGSGRRAGVRVGRYKADPFDRAAEQFGGTWPNKQETLADYVEWLLWYEREPEAAEASTHLTRPQLSRPTQIDALRDSIRRRRQRHP